MDNGPTSAAPPSPAADERTKRPRPSKQLPTDRIAFSKQLDILRAYAVAFEARGRPVSNSDVAAIVKMSPSTIPHANAFFSDVGWIGRQDGGYVPSAEVIAFQRQYAWDPETAPRKLAPGLSATWFAQALLPRLSFRGMLDRKAALQCLAEAAAASPEYRVGLDLLLDYLEAGGLVKVEGDTVVQERHAPSALASTGAAELPTAPGPLESTVSATLSAGARHREPTEARTVEQQLLDVLDPEAMSEGEQDAVWTLLKYLKRRAREAGRG